MTRGRPKVVNTNGVTRTFYYTPKGTAIIKAENNKKIDRLTNEYKKLYELAFGREINQYDMKYVNKAINNVREAVI
jgi:hypothetical protein